MNKSELTRPIDGLLKNNPIFINMIAVTAAVTVTRTLIGAAVFSAVLFCVLLLSSAIAYSVLRGVNTGLFSAVYMVIAAGITSVAEIVLTRFFSLHSDSPFYVPIIIISATLIALTSRSGGYIRSVGGSFFSGIGYGFVIIIIAAFRELLSTGMLFSFGERSGIIVFREWFIPIEAFATSAGALILVGISIAVLRMITYSVKETKIRRAAELEKIKRGEHEPLVYDSERGVVVFARTVAKKQLETETLQAKATEEAAETEEDFEFDLDEPVTYEENDEDVNCEEYDYE